MPPILRALLLLIVVIPIAVILIVAGFAFAAIVISVVLALAVLRVIRRSLGLSTRRMPASQSSPSGESSERGNIPVHDGEGRENVRVIRRD